MNQLQTHYTPERLVCIAGDAASGKDTVASAFVIRGFEHASLSDIVRSELQKRRIGINRLTQNQISNQMRLENGSDYWIRRAFEDIGDSADSVVLSGIYAPGEALHVTNDLGGHVVGVKASEDDIPSIRYARIVYREDGERDNLNFAEFEDAYIRENSGSVLSEANVRKVLEIAEFIVVSSADQRPVQDQVDEIIEDIGSLI